SLMNSRGHRLSRGLLPPMSLSAFTAIRREVREFKPDILVTFFAVPFGLPSVMLKHLTGVPLLLVLCGNDLPGPRTERVPLWASYLRWATGASDRVVYVSRFCFDALEHRPFREPHDVVLHGGVMQDQIRATDEQIAALRRRLSVGDDDLMLFSLSRLAPEKRVDVVVRAFAMLPDLGRRAVLVIGGQGSESTALQELALRLGVADRVRFVGYLGPEKATYYAASDLFVFHSIFETFGQVVAEAMMSGTPVVSVRAGALSEVVDDGVTGLLAEPSDPAALAAQMTRLMEDDDLRAAMGKAGRHRALTHFAWSDMSRKWQDVLSFVQPVIPLVPRTREADAHLFADSGDTGPIAQRGRVL
ncbi:MAG TPA: glycosyltransferase family 4 protein, partial [Coriobacteriia bacterium]|nr:glycosyltransferase family 4 protein [Coriobacteriia bacterium]